MALRARLAAPPPPSQQTWPWHKVRSASLSVSAFTGGDRRLEAETYLSSGFGIRTAIESKAGRWTRFHKLAKVWMPNRLKGIIVSSNYGKPFLAATQVFDVRPFSPLGWTRAESCRARRIVHASECASVYTSDISPSRQRAFRPALGARKRRPRVPQASLFLISIHVDPNRPH